MTITTALRPPIHVDSRRLRVQAGPNIFNQEYAKCSIDGF